MRVALLTREFPPEVYGGAGVHVEYLGRELAGLVDLDVYCWGADRLDPRAHAFTPWEAVSGGGPEAAALGAVSVDLLMAAAVRDADVVHSHTWYAQFGGHLAKLLYGIPHVATVHSLEPLRPWKAEQLGGGYALSSFCERVALEGADAIIAVSEGSRRDILDCYPAIDPGRVQVIYNGIDTAQYAPVASVEVLRRFGVDPARPSVVFVGRITRQKGVPLLLRAAARFDPSVQLVLCAGAPDTVEIGEEVAGMVADLRTRREGVIWIEQMLPKQDVIELLSHATAFACPSIYEPLGIVNLEAMACETAVVASATGGIVEVVQDGVTGFLVPISASPQTLEPTDPDGYAETFAARINSLVADPALAEQFGVAGRLRAVEQFGWPRIAEQTVGVYERVLGRRSPAG